jgi:DNA repair exonuclease SbcCD ATPase subunit
MNFQIIEFEMNHWMSLIKLKPLKLLPIKLTPQVTTPELLEKPRQEETSAPKIKLIQLKKIELTAEDLVIKSLGLDNHQIDNIIHISDIHIPTHLHEDRKDEYHLVFGRLYKVIEKQLIQNPNLIVAITGDLLHVKLNIEAETIILARNFLESLGKLCPTLLIIGNHDFAENNLERADSMTAVAHGIQNLYCLKYSGLYRLGNMIFAFSSLFDGKFIHHENIPDTGGLPVYKLFHGTVVGSENCNGTINKISHKRYPSVVDFNGYNAVLMGHVHKYQKLTESMAYAGSLIQQNFGEPTDHHGLLLWDTKTHMHTFHEIDNDYVFIDVHITNGVILNQSELDLYKGKFLRVRCQNMLTTASQYLTVQEELKKNHKIHQIKTGKPVEIRPSQLNSNDTSETKPNEGVAEIDPQQETELIRKLVKPGLCKEILDLHTEFATSTQTTHPSASWNITSVRFQNMFVYGNDHINYVDFSQGIHNICSANMTGKTSLTCVIAFALYHKTSNNASHKSNIVHMGKESGFIELTFTHNGNNYLIEKIAQTKVKAGEKSISFVTNFYRIDPSTEVNGPSTEVNGPSGKVCLNGKDSTETIKIIGQYVGDFNLFSTHYIISTRCGSSVILMTPAEKLKHFHRLCGTDRYNDQLQLCKDKHKIVETDLNLTTKEHLTLKKTLNQIDLMKANADVTDCQTQIPIRKASLNQSIEHSQLLSTQMGQIKSNMDQLKSEITEVNDQPSSDRQAILVNITEIEAMILKHDPNGSLHSQIQNQTTKSLQTLLEHYQSQLIVVPPQNEITNQLAHLQSQIEGHNQTQPEHDLSTIKQEMNQIKYKINQLVPDINKFKSFASAQVIDDRDQVPLIAKVEDSKAVMSALKFWSKSTLTLDECQQQLSLIDPIKLGIDPIKLGIETLKEKEVSDQLAIHKHQMIQLKPQIAKIAKLSMSPTQLTVEQLNQKLQKELYVGRKHNVTMTQINSLQTSIAKLTGDIPLIPCSSALAILDGLTFDEHHHAQISFDNTQALRALLTQVDQGNLEEINRLTGQLRDLQAKWDQNLQIDQDLKSNLQIQENNIEIENQIRWLEYQQLLTDFSIIEQQNKVYSQAQQYFTLTHLRDYLTAEQNLNNAQHQLQLIEKYENRLRLESLRTVHTELKTELSLFEGQLQWHFLNQSLQTELQQWMQYQSQSQANSEAQAQIFICNQQLELVDLLHQIKVNRLQLAIWDRIDTNTQLLKQIQVHQQQLIQLSQELGNLKQSITREQTQVSNLEKQLHTALNHIDQHTQFAQKSEQLQLKMTELEAQIRIYVEYERLFNNNLIPYQLMSLKLTSFNTLVNQIFEKYTKYTFQIDQSQSGKLVFLVTNRTNQCVLEPERVSGFEYIILQLAINNAMLTITNTYRCGFIIVDETFDCIDQARFIEELPSITETIKQYYQTILFISHRDVPEELIDQQLKIQHYGSYSTINHGIA